MSRTLTIVFQETDDEGNFSCSLEGDKERIGKMENHHLSEVEFWAMVSYMKMVKTMEDAGITRSKKFEGIHHG